MHRVLVGLVLVGMMFVSFMYDAPSAWALRKIKVEVQLLPGFCSPKEGCTVIGRLVRHSRTIAKNNKDHRKKMNIRAGLRRFTRRSVKRKWVDIQMGRQRKRVRSGKYGLFSVHFPFPLIKDGSKTRKIAQWGRSVAWGGRSGVYRVVATFVRQGRYLASSTTGTLMAPRSSSVGLSVVTDLDDTLIVSDAYSKRKVVKKSFNTHASQISVIPDAMAFLQSILRSPVALGGGSLHYVSGSPFAIIDRVLWLFQFRHFPVGSLQLAPIFRAHHFARHKTYSYKVKHISEIFRRYPKRRFLLVGDSGEKDPDVYAQIRRLFPSQVAGILIRHVPTTSVSGPRYKGIFTFRHYKQAIGHARQQGWIQVKKPSSPKPPTRR